MVIREVVALLFAGISSAEGNLLFVFVESAITGSGHRSKSKQVAKTNDTSNFFLWFVILYLPRIHRTI